VLKRLERTGRPVILAINKVDRVRPRERLLPWIAEISRRFAFADIVPLSALKSDNVEALKRAIVFQSCKHGVYALRIDSCIILARYLAAR